MKLPRDLTGEELAKLLGRFGYQLERQTGSHMRLTRRVEGEQRITIPRHSALKVGTLNSILKDVAEHLKMSKEELVQKLWGGS